MKLSTLQRNAYKVMKPNTIPLLWTVNNFSLTPSPHITNSIEEPIFDLNSRLTSTIIIPICLSYYYVH